MFKSCSRTMWAQAGGSAEEVFAVLDQADQDTASAEKFDEGSITPLAIGFLVIALLLSFLIAALTDLQLARTQLQNIADSAALAASDSFEPAPGSEPGLVFSAEAAERAARDYVSSVELPPGLDNLGIDAESDGEHSVAIRLRASYSPSFLSPSVPDVIDLSATAFARGALRIG